MELKHGGGLRMTATMQQPVNHAENFMKEKAKRDRAQAERERRDHEFAVKLRADQMKMDAEYGPRTEKAWEALQWQARERPVSDAQWKETQKRAGTPSMGLEMTDTRARAVAEATAPVDQGILGLGILSTIRNRLTQITEQSEREGERLRKLNRPSIF